MPHMGTSGIFIFRIILEDYQAIYDLFSDTSTLLETLSSLDVLSVASSMGFAGGLSLVTIDFVNIMPILFMKHILIKFWF